MTVYVEYQNRSGTGINKGDQSHLKVIQKLPLQYTWESRYQGTTEKSHTRTADKKVLKQNYKFYPWK
jgi:hypothetical protein